MDIPQIKFSENIKSVKEKLMYIKRKPRHNSINLFDNEMFLNTTCKSNILQFRRSSAEFRSNSQRCDIFQSQSFQ